MSFFVIDFILSIHTADPAVLENITVRMPYVVEMPFWL